MKLKMTRNMLLVKQDAKEEMTKGGLILADTDTQKAAPRGVVLSVGKDVVDIGVGDRVIWGEYAGQTIIIDDDEEARVMTDVDIIALEV